MSDLNVSYVFYIEEMLYLFPLQTNFIWFLLQWLLELAAELLVDY